mgnify:CR=1 FL=1
MINIKKIEVNEFDDVLKFLGVFDSVNKDYLYDVYSIVVEGLKEIDDETILNRVNNINQLEVIQYILGEYLYSVIPLPKEAREKFETRDDFKQQMASVAADKYLSLSFFVSKEKRLANLYIPPMSSLNLYINFMLNFVQNYKQNDPKINLVADLLNKSLSITKCILKLLMDGYETEAFASWRTLHECECTLILLDKYPSKAIPAYLKHMRYGLAFKNVLPEKEEIDKIFVQIKEEMKVLDLKSKDIKKYIEYGWLTSIADFKNDTYLKFNFRDGLEALAGLHDYSSRYMESSEILHSTPLLIYSNKQYFYFITLLSTYESFFRLEKVFVSLFASKVSKEMTERYAEIRKVYYQQLIEIHKREVGAFVNWQKSVKK